MFDITLMTARYLGLRVSEQDGTIGSNGSKETAAEISNWLGRALYGDSHAIAGEGI